MVNWLVVVIVPVVVFIGVGQILLRISGRDQVAPRLLQAAEPDRKPLGQRLAYGADAVDRYWKALGGDGRTAEARFLECDLIFPFLYGGALAGSLLAAWALLGRPFHPAFAIAPIAIVMIADWTENLVQLTQLARYSAGGAASLQAGWLTVASTATALKILAGGGSFIFLLSLVLAGLVQAFNVSKV